MGDRRHCVKKRPRPQRHRPGAVTGTPRRLRPQPEGPRESGIQGLRDQGTQGLRDTGTKGMRRRRAIRHSAFAIRNSQRDRGSQGVRDSGIKGLRDQGTQGLRDTGTKGARRRRAIRHSPFAIHKRTEGPGNQGAASEARAPPREPSSQNAKKSVVGCSGARPARSSQPPVRRHVVPLLRRPVLTNPAWRSRLAGGDACTCCRSLRPRLCACGGVSSRCPAVGGPAWRVRVR